jgi:hypothetical protein
MLFIAYCRVYPDFAHVQYFSRVNQTSVEATPILPNCSVNFQLQLGSFFFPGTVPVKSYWRLTAKKRCLDQEGFPALGGERVM